MDEPIIFTEEDIHPKKLFVKRKTRPPEGATSGQRAPCAGDASDEAGEISPRWLAMSVAGGCCRGERQGGQHSLVSMSGGTDRLSV